MAKKRPNKKIRELMARMVDGGCIICERPAEIHHLTNGGMGLKSKVFIPLCADHHRLGNIGVAIHAGVETWETKFGTQEELYNLTMERLGYGSSF